MNEQKAVLVVDDEPYGFDVIEAHLYRERYNLTYASSGLQALSLIDSLEPDVILLDVMMPELDGIEVCQIIKSDSRWKHIPIIIVTALNSKEDLARSIDAGADDFLTKPVSGVELRARVRSMLRIKQQYDELQATLQMREDLSSMIVHDLRTPLTTIMLMSSLLINSEIESKNIARLKLILSAGRQLNTMLNDLLILAKMQSGKMVLNLAEVNLSDLAKQAFSEVYAIAESRKIILTSEIAEPSYFVSIDANLLHRVLDNLLSNAIKFSPPESKITLKIDYQSQPIVDVPKVATALLSKSAQKRATIKITDEGPGISENLQQQIFDKYEVGNVMSGVPQLGLGLAFCKMVVEAHQGKIFVEDNQPHGSIFTVVI